MRPYSLLRLSLALLVSLFYINSGLALEREVPEVNMRPGANEADVGVRPGQGLIPGRGQTPAARQAEAAIGRAEARLGGALPEAARNDIRAAIVGINANLTPQNGRQGQQRLTPAQANAVASAVLQARDTLPAGETNLTPVQALQAGNAGLWASTNVRAAAGSPPGTRGFTITLAPGGGAAMVNLNRGSTLTGSWHTNTQSSRAVPLTASRDNQVSCRMESTTNATRTSETILRGGDGAGAGAPLDPRNRNALTRPANGLVGFALNGAAPIANRGLPVIPAGQEVTLTVRDAGGRGSGIVMNMQTRPTTEGATAASSGVYTRNATETPLNITRTPDVPNNLTVTINPAMSHNLGGPVVEQLHALASPTEGAAGRNPAIAAAVLANPTAQVKVSFTEGVNPVITSVQVGNTPAIAVTPSANPAAVVSHVGQISVVSQGPPPTGEQTAHIQSFTGANIGGNPTQIAVATLPTENGVRMTGNVNSFSSIARTDFHLYAADTTRSPPAMRAALTNAIDNNSPITFTFNTGRQYASITVGGQTFVRQPDNHFVAAPFEPPVPMRR